MIKQYADIQVFDRNGQLALITEAKNKRNTTSEWATKMRRNMYAHGLLPAAPYFLLALPDRFYLWKDAGAHPELIEPTSEVDPHPFLLPYYERLGISPVNLPGQTFELVVSSWLEGLLRISDRHAPRADYDWLIRSGLLPRLVGGHLQIEEAA